MALAAMAQPFNQVDAFLHDVLSPMRHQKKTVKLGRTAEHRKALLANQVCSLIEHERIKTTLAKAKAVRPLAERMVTLGKNGSLHARRTAFAVLRQKSAVKKLFDDIAPRSTDRNGGYTRIIKLGPRPSDSALVAFLEWVDAAPATEEKPAKKAAKEKAPKAEKPSPAGPKPAPAEKEATTAAKEPETTAAPAEEPKPKKRKWFGRKSSDEK
jgi:large subunit ribosomal protein L17